MLKKIFLVLVVAGAATAQDTWSSAQFSGTSCAGAPYHVQVKPLGCLPDGISGSRLYSCSNNVLSVKRCSDTICNMSCTEVSGIPKNCTAVDTSTSTMFTCGVPVNTGLGDYVVTTNYNGTSCPGPLLSQTMVLADVCHPNSDAPGKFGIHTCKGQTTTCDDDRCKTNCVESDQPVVTDCVSNGPGQMKQMKCTAAPVNPPTSAAGQGTSFFALMVGNVVLLTVLALLG